MINKFIDIAGSMGLVVTKSRTRPAYEPESPFFSAAQLGEKVASRFAFFARLYFSLFYRTMLVREVGLADLKPGASILHIGGGAYPYTAVFLAREGYRVDACDCEGPAVETSRKIIAKKGLADKVNIYHENGCTIDCSGYDAVWVSLNICPKERVLEQSWSSLKKDGILVYRKLPAWLKLFGKKDVVFNEGGVSVIRKARSRLGAESVVIKKTRREKFLPVKLAQSNKARLR